ncbi:hypothetical protein N7533_008037 [Penicillium manginii]|jgi:hypothetical protein|uniref:uncharacterized protein n=1 Tax=Penicillium manginii TaxID=203109 RepID=UPI002547ED32|nr:uncharacterized protein N7533_008037 [Penicillium manginii]KAJ5751009.1 hypothetical protein N7533_008037 [Penicillium manginii]
MMEDSGASVCTLYEDDVKNLWFPRPTNIPLNAIIGRLPLSTSNGSINQPIMKVEICLPHDGQVVIPWTPIQVMLFEGKKLSGCSERLMGPVLRRMAFTATAPDNRDRLFVANDRQELIDLIPDADVSQAFMPDLPLDPHDPNDPLFDSDLN